MKPGMTVMAGLAAMIVAASASATLTGISLGTAAPPATIGTHTMLPFPRDPQPRDGALVASVPSPLGGVVSLLSETEHRRIGFGWATWSHGYTGDVYVREGAAATQLLTMPAATFAFYLYVEGNNFTAANFSMQATNGAAETSTVSLLGVMGQGGAAGAGFASSGSSITSILITNTDGTSNGFAVGEFGIGLDVPGPGALVLFGAAGLVARRRRRA
jgi:MYXO-CTERM domain-containing protein